MVVYVRRRVQGAWYVNYVDPADAFAGSPTPAVVHTTWWDTGAGYRDPHGHPVQNGVNAGRNRRKLDGLRVGCVVIMQVDHRNKPGLRATGRYAGEFQVINSVINADGSHELVLQDTGREIRMEGR